MKKLLLGFFTLILLVIAGIYIFIPGQITITKSVSMAANRDALLRKLQSGASWKEWWPGNEDINDTALSYSLKGIRFTPRSPRALSVPVLIQSGGFETSTDLTLLPQNMDSTTLHLEAVIPFSTNPVKRFRQYLKTEKLENSFSEILQSIRNRYSSITNLYDYDIQKKKVVDSILISTFAENKGYPSITRIYELIDQLKDYIKKNAAADTGFPMLNIYTADSVNYLVRVAIPVDKKLPGSGNISYKSMLGGGNILVTEVKGGKAEINKAYKQIMNYMADHSRTPPAIPFESLVTDRRNEPDSSKWITRIYYPVM